MLLIQNKLDFHAYLTLLKNTLNIERRVSINNKWKKKNQQ